MHRVQGRRSVLRPGRNEKTGVVEVMERVVDRLTGVTPQAMTVAQSAGDGFSFRC